MTDVSTSSHTNSLTNASTVGVMDDGLPPAVCTYYANSIKGIGQGCLRVNCKFFHGSEEQLAELRFRCSVDEPLAAGMTAVGAAKRRKPTQDVSSNTKRPIVCLNYLTDTCHRPACRFLHLPPEIRPLPMATCEYFLRGNCTRDTCRFFHGSAATLNALHSQGATMYNPFTNIAYDPTISVEDLMRAVASSHAARGQMATHAPFLPPSHPIGPPSILPSSAVHSTYLFKNQPPAPPATMPYSRHAIALPLSQGQVAHQAGNTLILVVDHAMNQVHMHTVHHADSQAQVMMIPSSNLNYALPPNGGAAMTGYSVDPNGQHFLQAGLV